MRWMMRTLLFVMVSVICVLPFRTGQTVVKAAGQCEQPPIARDDKAILFDRRTNIDIHVLANDSDPNGCGIHLKGFTRGSRGLTTFTAYPGDGQIYYEYLGVIMPSLTDSFTYTIENDGGKTATATVHIVLYDPNLRPPIVHDVSVIGYPSYYQQIDVLKDAVDPDADGTNRGLRLESMVYDYYHIEPYIFKYYPHIMGLWTMELGQYTITYTARSDATNLTATGKVFVDVRPPVPPIANEDFATTKPGVRVEIDVLKNDSRPVVVDRYSGLRIIGIDNKLTPQPLKGRFQFANDEIFFTPDRDMSGTYVFYYRVQDGYIGGISSGKVTVTIQP